MSAIGSVGIIGLGLIGGSLARDLAARGVRVRAADRDSAALRAAMEEGVVEAALDPARVDVAGLDAVVLAVPLNAALDILEQQADRLSDVALITDVSSTKQTIQNAALRLGLGERFIGGHPVAGDHRSGWAVSRVDLFRSATVYLCPGAESSAQSLALLRELWRGVGAVPVVIDPASHDRLLAWTSHLPQAVATALARALAGAGIQSDRLGPGGRDMTRLAGSSPDVWTPIALDNAASLCLALDTVEHELAALRRALRAADHDAARRFFAMGREPAS